MKDPLESVLVSINDSFLTTVNLVKPQATEKALAMPLLR